MAIDYVALNTELTTDPFSLGYAAAARYVDAAEIANTPRVGGPTTDQRFVSGQEVWLQAVLSEFAALPASGQRAFAALSSYDSIDLKEPRVRSQLTALWADGTVTRTRLQALQSRPQTRAEELFGDDSIVSGSDVRKALEGI